ncbi:hypothetical protein AHMF7605_22775 [Adhaeribacter arboris]|uniref:Uncharacterized protein n=1 Tax=Adhaeribacter arboris TaxID=2072846 RepID=A0A2T2YKT1_9BACT|nr:hypothetical protein [Adhaeribacter arboris]PSR56126.1 hypothetical protein AHMF7605_22775 [Adhaeribacter arboris]
MKRFLIKSNYFFTLLGVIISSQAFSQVATNDSAYLATRINNLISQYDQAIGDQKILFNGKEYLTYDKYYLKGHQFFRSGEEQEGDVYYDGYLFTNVPLLYDVLLDQIVISEPNGSLLFKLENKKVNYFKVHDHTFIRLAADTLSESPVKTGFYDLLVDGKTKLLAKRVKRVYEDATIRGMEGEFITEDRFFIRKNDQYYPVSKKKAVLKILTDNKKELQKYSRNQHLKFKKETREYALVKLIQYYNNLPPGKSP